MEERCAGSQGALGGPGELHGAGPLRAKRACWTRIPDVLTWARVGLGLVFLSLAFIVRRYPLALLVWLVCLGWLTDALDGFLARVLREEGSSWVGRRDHLVDAFFAACLVICLLGSEYVSGAFGVVFGAIAVFAMLLRSRVLNMTFITAAYLAFILITVQRSTVLGFVLIGYALVAMTVDWKRFKSLVGLYLSGARELIHGKHDGGS